MENNLPIVLLKGFIILPHQEVRLDLNNDISRQVINFSSLSHNDHILVVCPTDQMEEAPDVSDLPKVGVVARIKTKIELPNGNLRIVLIGVERVLIKNYYNYNSNFGILGANIIKIELPKFNEIEEAAKLKMLIDILKKYIKRQSKVSNSILEVIKKTDSIDKISDMITIFVPFNLEKKLLYMAELNPLKRAEALIKDLNVELEIISLDKKIEKNLCHVLEESQKEFILREKIKEIKKELGEVDYKSDEVMAFKEKLNSLDLNEKIHRKLENEIKKYELCSITSPEITNLRNYIDTVLNLPWNKYSLDEKNIDSIRKHLNKTHFGLDKAKDRIIEYIAVKLRNYEINSPIICLVGAPGVGKTSLAISIASALKKEFYKISVGGLNDSNELIGHRRTYLGATTGKIMQALSKCNTKNPVILIDEVDKMVKDFKGDPASILLDILDVNQNKMFIDNFIEEPFDLSKVLFILTANYEDNIPWELYDRLEIIKIDSYTQFDKVDIAKKYLLPVIYNNHKITNKELFIKEDIITKVINSYTKEAGVRELERQLSAIVRKVITEKLTSKLTSKKTIKNEDLIKYLGYPKYEKSNNDIIKDGLVTGLAYTPYGGVTLKVESCMFAGKGAVSFTGHLGKVMQESSQIALSFIKSNAKTFKINQNIFEKYDFHLNAIETAVPKEGPSAGVTIVTSLLSLILEIPVLHNIAMTGEITLRGEVLKVGGIKEKVIGAFNNNVDTIFLPKENINDIEDIPAVVKNKITFIFVNEYQEIFDYLFKK